jgi:hypothetical protein
MILRNSIHTHLRLQDKLTLKDANFTTSYLFLFVIFYLTGRDVFSLFIKQYKNNIKLRIKKITLKSNENLSNVFP